jgi:hypothetical protein
MCNRFVIYKKNDNDGVLTYLGNMRRSHVLHVGPVKVPKERMPANIRMKGKRKMPVCSCLWYHSFVYGKINQEVIQVAFQIKKKIPFCFKEHKREQKSG